ncbi:hypothetical protein G6F70_002833 [Rhizopus microsporus]|nr:hypothetical protein G6F71_002767 [Rhizopus microsporus]KAG1201783.1 hypothetical protein G6F70_002833 [Rhizopus microsporus]KAG1211651.1 hypothetical protein G6F69_004399 [Rhizopus microsporus]KAG1233615.1 hypothetical protein G6F67_004136 [Rhizopus microsporus]KAG1266068.1 hypothetical protein G6F68_003045 [Rhizopus microsporus]
MTIAGVAMIYLTSLLLYDVPYPTPVYIPHVEKRKNGVSDQVILTAKKDYIYNTQLVFDQERSESYFYSTSALKVGTFGRIIQTKKLKDDLSQPIEAEWKSCFNHTIDGTIVNVSESPNDGLIQFAVLYRRLEKDDLLHYVRVYYFPDQDDDMQYKDLFIPGTTLVKEISLEDDCILLHRDPDNYRFRIIPLPQDITAPPHSEEMGVIYIGQTTPGDPIRAYHQPRDTEAHAGLLSKLYSPNPDIIRVLTLDIYQTTQDYYINLTIVDGTPYTKDKKIGEWIRQGTFKNRERFPRYINSVPEFSHIDTYQHPIERIENPMPVPFMTRSSHGKSLVTSIAKHFYTFDFTNNITNSDHLYKHINGTVMSEAYNDAEDDTMVDDSDIVGLKLNEDATLLAVWTETQSVYIFKRGVSDSEDASMGKISPHNLRRSLRWKPRMVIHPMDGKLGVSYSTLGYFWLTLLLKKVGSVLFWKDGTGNNYISVGMKSTEVNTYFIDEYGEVKEWSFTNFVKDRYGLVCLMLAVVALFAANEYQTH